MRTTQLLLATVKETPSDADTISQQLMLRAGMVRKLSSGLYTWLPLGLRVLRKIEKVIREEMNTINAQEVLMPTVQPAELWEETQRWDKYGPMLLKIIDRNERLFCFGPTHEEVCTDLIRREISSYKQLPITLYQIQTKFRDEIRPRFGVMRAREFIMKDAYSYHLDQASLEETYQAMFSAYSKIFTRLGLNFRAVQADTGEIGGSTSHEFHVLADAGEDQIFYCPQSEYAANRELAEAALPKIDTAAEQALSKVATPNERSIEEVCALLKVPAQRTVKCVLVKGIEQPVVALLLRGDHQLNEVKAAKCEGVFSPVTMADAESLKKVLSAETGFIGPVNMSIPFYIDREAIALNNFICGANETGYHLENVNWARDVFKQVFADDRFAHPQVRDLRNVEIGDESPDHAGKLEMLRGIEVGHIFQLGTKYTEAMKVTVLNENGQNQLLTMGCYGIGVTRIVAAAIEQNHDAQGIIWPENIAPFQIALLAINSHKSQRLREAAEDLYQKLTAAGYEVLYDDRKERAGVMFADMELIGIPHRLVLGDRGLDEGTIEYKNRRTGAQQIIPLKNLLDVLKEI